MPVAAYIVCGALLGAAAFAIGQDNLVHPAFDPTYRFGRTYAGVILAHDSEKREFDLSVESGYLESATRVRFVYDNQTTWGFRASVREESGAQIVPGTLPAQPADIFVGSRIVTTVVPEPMTQHIRVSAVAILTK